MLKAYLSSLPDDAARRSWAESCGTSLAHLRNCVYRPKPVKPETCVLIERNSAGRVRRWHLRPADWHRIWPELIGAQGAPIVGPDATPENQLVTKRRPASGRPETEQAAA